MRQKKKSKSYLTPNDVAELLMVSPVTIRQWAQKGSLNALTTPGGHRRFLIREVERFAREHGIALQPVDNDELRILIVDNDKQLSSYLFELLSNQDQAIKTEVASDGFDAGAKVQTFKPHVLLLDLMMPGLDGFDICRRLREDPTTKAMRIIAMTDLHNPESVERVKNTGADECFSKPLPTDELLKAIGIYPK